MGNVFSRAKVFIRLSVTITLLFGVVSCSQLMHVNCDPHSWEGLGIRDGLRGTSSRAANEYERTCRQQSKVFDRQAYEAGLKEGNAHYCSGQNGFHLGLSGVETKRACVNESAVAFKEGLKAGRKLRKAALDLDESNFPTKHDLGGFTIAVSSGYSVGQAIANDQDLDEELRGLWEPVMLTPRHSRAGDKRIQRTKIAILIARCEEAKQNAEKRGFYTSLKCSLF